MTSAAENTAAACAIHRPSVGETVHSDGHGSRELHLVRDWLVDIHPGFGGPDAHHQCIPRLQGCLPRRASSASSTPRVVTSSLSLSTTSFAASSQARTISA